MRIPAVTIALAFVLALTAPCQDAGPLDAVPATAVHIDDAFWAPRIEATRVTTLPAVLRRCEATGRLANFARASGREDGGFEGYFFNDSDVYKVIEGAAWLLALRPDADLETRISALIADIAAAQEPDGYLNTHFSLSAPDRKWSDLRVKHELYCAGHLFEAAVAWYEATARRSLLDVAVKSADLVYRRFAVENRPGVPGHQEIVIGLVRLHEVTRDARYLELARRFMERRGRPEGRELFGAYCQDHAPVTEQGEAVGHAVRAAYMYCGMADLVARGAAPEYRPALERLWTDVVHRKLYLTGGIGARRAGEAFGAAYELPNASAYAETCGAIANALWNHRMLLLSGEGRCGDVLERVLFNGFLAGVSLDGGRFFYPNPLAAEGQAFNHGHRDRQPWFNCACCPTNVVRFLPQLGRFVYATGPAKILVNLYVQSRAVLSVDGREVRIRQRTSYPWEGAIELAVDPAEPAEFEIRLRVPGWARGRPLPGDLYRYSGVAGGRPELRVNGEAHAIELDRGCVALHRRWCAGDRIELRLPMTPRRVVAHPEIAADRGRVALERGPIVYCVEGGDVGGTVTNLLLPDASPVAVRHRPHFLGGVGVLEGEAWAWREIGEDRELRARRILLSAVPYFAWNHRGPGEMAVWLPREARALRPLPAPTLASLSRVSASHCWSGDRVSALNDRREPASSADHEIPRLTWWDHRGTREWVQYELPEVREVSEVAVYWFDDSGRGGCRVPQSWRVLVRDAGAWGAVNAAGGYGIARDGFNRVSFAAVRTGAVRLEVELQPGFSGGILEWRLR